MAKNNSKVTSDKVIDYMAYKARMGSYPSNHPPLGYVTVKITDSATGRAKNRGTTIGLDPNENNRKIVLREFELRSKGFTYEEIRKDFPEERFVRIHRSYIVNISAIEQLSSTKIRLTNGQELPVSRSYQPAVKNITIV